MACIFIQACTTESFQDAYRSTQELGIALYEEVRYGSDGQNLTDSLDDYLLPGAPDVPDIEVYHYETPSPFTEYG